MKREPSLLPLAAALVLLCAIFRLLSGLFPAVVPNFSPLLALAYVGGIYLPRRWGWLVGPLTYGITVLAFLSISHRVGGSVFSWWTLISLEFYLGAALLGRLLAAHKSLARILAGSVALCLLFYVLSNSFCWVESVFLHSTPGYPASFLGWWQANTVGLPGYAPSWIFLRNSLPGDLGFTLGLIFVFDRDLILRHVPGFQPLPGSLVADRR